MGESAGIVLSGKLNDALFVRLYGTDGVGGKLIGTLFDAKTAHCFQQRKTPAN